MYRLVKDDATLTTLSSPVWVKLQSNGAFALCAEAEAQGVVLNGEVYHISGTDALEGKETVVVSEISETAYLTEQLAAQESIQIQNQIALAELSILIATGGTTSV